MDDKTERQLIDAKNVRRVEKLQLQKYFSAIIISVVDDLLKFPKKEPKSSNIIILASVHVAWLQFSFWVCKKMHEMHVAEKYLCNRVARFGRNA